MSLLPATAVRSGGGGSAPASRGSTGRHAVRPGRRRAAAGALAAAGAGLLLELSFAPVGAWPLAPVGVAALALAVRAPSGGGLRRGAALGLVAGLALFVPLLRWEAPVGGALAWLALAALQALFLAPLGVALALVSRLPGWPVWGAALWVAEEALRDRVPFGGFSWGRLAFSQGGTPLTPLAAVGGAPLVSFAVALLGGLLAALVVGLRGRPLAAVAVPAMALAVAGPLVPTPTAGPAVRVAVVQGNVPRLGLDAFTQRAAVLGNHVAATRQLAADVRAGRAARPDLVVWPENASDLDPFRDPQAYAQIDAAVRDVGVPVLVGAVLSGPGENLSNTGIVWSPTGGAGASYVKQHPVPFGEYMPFRSLLRRITTKVDLVPRDFVKGDRTGLLQVGPATVGDVICFEVAYDGLVRDTVLAGGRLLVVQTNNASFGRSAETDQQLAMGRLRAVEHGRAVVVAATSGISAVIEPDGRLAQQTNIFTREVLLADVPQRSGLTVATRLGAAPELLIAGLGVGAALAAAPRARRSRRPAGSRR